MATYPGIYRGADYGFEPVFEEDPFGAPIGNRYSIKAGQFGVTTDPRSANQLKEVSDKLSSGAKTIEVSGISTEVLESVPEQHFKEIARLKKLAGADITFHGPLVEPTGFNQQGKWEETSRANAERQIWDAVKRGQAMNEDGNLVVTLHTSNGLLSPSTIIKDNSKEGVEKGVMKNIAVINEYTGDAGYVPLETDEFEDPNKTPTAKEAIDKINRKFWDRDVTNILISSDRGRSAIKQAFSGFEDEHIQDTSKKQEIDELRKLYSLYKEDRKTYEEVIENKSTPLLSLSSSQLGSRVEGIAYGEAFTRDSYEAMKELWSKAKEGLEIEMGKNPNNPEIKKAYTEVLNYREEAAKKLKDYKEDPLKVKEFAEEVAKGIRLLSTISHVPQQYRPVEDFAVDKASETFSNVALNAYKKFGDKAPILSLENPPVGMGLSRADEIVKLVEATRKRLSNNLKGEGLSSKEADETAKKLIGVTWDVGHINMLKKYGFDNTDIVHETEKVKPYLKHIHLSDNFGLEHTELPMGMGNVPMEGHIKAIGEKIKDFKHIIETGGHWYQDFKTSPLPATLAAFGSQLYPMTMQPYWDQAQAASLGGGYFSGYGMNPDVHHSVYGAGFSNLPKELGGQIGGRNRLSGNPLE